MLETISIPAGTDIKRDSHRRFWSDMAWRTIHCIVGEKGNMSISQIASAADTTVDDAVAALEAMEMIGLIQRTENGYKTLVPSWTRDYSKERIAAIKDFAVSTHQVVNRLLENPDQPQNYTRRILYNSNEELLSELVSDINAAVEKFKQKSDTCKPDGVYAFSVAITPMTHRGIYE